MACATSWRASERDAPLFNRLALIGFGLIGGSIARAARAQGARGEIVTTARSAADPRARAELGIVDQVVETNAEAVEGADLVILCIPVGACGAGRAGDRAASQKPARSSPTSARSRARCCATWRRILPPACISCPAHPVAGTEHSGPDSGFAELFVNRWCILTPPEGTDPAAVEKLRAFWAARRQGRDHDADHHDLVLAITSHLPHLIAYTIVGTADELAQVTRPRC
jgi:cyclohexadieny/prephenate dehydrogenase